MYPARLVAIGEGAGLVGVGGEGVGGELAEESLEG
jgi:hypothetical protein